MDSRIKSEHVMLFRRARRFALAFKPLGNQMTFGRFFAMLYNVEHCIKSVKMFFRL